MTRLELDSVTKVFGDPGGEGIVAVDDLSLGVSDGEFLVLLGPSGCGKTTTLRVIGGLEDLTEGEVLFDGTVVNEVKTRNRDVAMVFQDFALYPHMSVRRNLRFGLEREENDLSEAEMDERVEETAEMLEIEELLESRPAELSGGQKQRVALGRAIIRDPRLFLFDAPLANLDANLRKAMRTEIEELQTRVGITSVYVTHNQEEAMTLADRIAVMNGGELQQVGTPSETFNEPANTFVAEFIGSPSINLFEASISHTGEAYELGLDGVSFDIPTDSVPEPIEEDHVVVGIRPQDIFRTGGNSDGPSFETEVKLVEPLGTEAVIHTETPIGELQATTDQFRDLGRGQSIPLGVDPRNVYLFSETSGELIKGRGAMERSATGADAEGEQSGAAES